MKSNETPKTPLTVFNLTADAAIEFYQRCILENLNTEQERIDLLLEMAHEGKIVAISQTGRTKEQYIKDMTKEYVVWDLTSGTPPEDLPSEEYPNA